MFTEADIRIGRNRVVAASGGRAMTKQSMALETDVNSIVARHVAHRVPFFPDGAASYGDFSSGLDYHSALNALNAARSEFGKLPAAVRSHCENDPGKFLDMVMDPARRDELVKLGLVPEAIPAPKAPDPVPPVVPAVPVVPPV